MDTFGNCISSDGWEVWTSHASQASWPFPPRRPCRAPAFEGCRCLWLRPAATTCGPGWARTRRPARGTRYGSSSEGPGEVPKGESMRKMGWWLLMILLYIYIIIYSICTYIYNISLSLSLSLAFSLHIVQGVVDDDDDDDIFWHYFLEHIITTYNSLHIVIICYYHRWYYCVDDVDKENVRAHKHDK